MRSYEWRKVNAEEIPAQNLGRSYSQQLAVLLAPATISPPPFPSPLLSSPFLSVSRHNFCPTGQRRFFLSPQQDFKPTDRGREGERRHICACAHSYALHSSGTDKRRREVDISCRSELSIPDDTRSRYRASLKGGPYVARSFCLALPGCCLAKQVLLSVDLCTNST